MYRSVRLFSIQQDHTRRSSLRRSISAKNLLLFSVSSILPLSVFKNPDGDRLSTNLSKSSLKLSSFPFTETSFRYTSSRIVRVLVIVLSILIMFMFRFKHTKQPSSKKTQLVFQAEGRLEVTESEMEPQECQEFCSVFML
jgi:hypothetical protein